MKTDADYQSRIMRIENINTMIFDLNYYAHFSFQDCESMTSVELKWFHKRLVEVKEAEKERHEQVMKEAKEASDKIKSKRKR